MREIQRECVGQLDACECDREGVCVGVRCMCEIERECVCELDACEA